MRGRERKLSFIIVIVLLVGGLLWGRWEDISKEYYKFPDVPKVKDIKTSDLSEKAIQVNETVESTITGRTNYRQKSIVVDDQFRSNLPLVVIDTNGQEPKRSATWDGEKGYYVPNLEDAYAYGEISVIDNKSGLNSPDESSALKSNMKIKIRGNSSGNYDKNQYLLKLLKTDGKEKKENILGMGSDSEWILNVSFIDKSLLRNYLAYTAAGQVMPYTPDARYCEVLWKDGNQYRYEGVYMMLESVKVGKHRVNLPQYSENSRFAPTLLRRDRYNLNGIMLENYATKKELTPGFLDVEYPAKDKITEKGIKKITQQISAFEKALYAEKWDQFVQYREFVDMDSFVDYFIFNEFFLNYDAGYNSTYAYMDYSGKLSMGPVWDFDQAMDNNETEAAVMDTTAFHSAPWFDHMLQDPVFTDRIINRYKQLRKSILSDEALRNFTYDTINYLGNAIDRDWARWGYYYKDGQYLQQVSQVEGDRNTKSHIEEVERILNVLSEHGKWMDEHLDSLYQFKKISLEEAQNKVNKTPKEDKQILAIIFVGIFLISIHLVLRYERE